MMQQKRARNTQNTERVIMFMSKMENQKRTGISWPTQKMITLIVAGTLTCDD